MHLLGAGFCATKGALIEVTRKLGDTKKVWGRFTVIGGRRGNCNSGGGAFWGILATIPWLVFGVRISDHLQAETVSEHSSPKEADQRENIVSR